MRIAALALLIALPALADEAELRKAAVEGRAALARAAAADGLVEEAVREWQFVRRDDPGNSEAAKGIEAAGRPWVPKWDDAMQKKFAVWSTKARALDADLGRRWAAVAAERDKAGDRDACWEACQRAFVNDPDCDKAHNLLGEAKYDGGWVTEGVAAQRTKGLLELHGEWLPAADVRKKRMEWADAWEADGPHFHVRSNRGQGPVRSVLANAEEVHAAFYREIMGIVDPSPETIRLAVLDFRTPADLETHIQADHGGGVAPKGVPGFYTPGEAVHLTDLPEGSALSREEVILHECCHSAAGRAIKLEGWINSRPHFWAWEGLASYFESTEIRGGKILTGSTANIRLQLARDECKAGKFTPLAQFVQLDQDGLGKQYQQAAALAHFFLHAADGKYREAFVAYFKVVSSGLAEKDAFDKAFARAPETFDAEFKAHVLAFPEIAPKDRR